MLITRNRVFQSAGIFAITLGFLASFMISTAQAESDAQTRGIEEVVVTAQKREQSLMDAAIDVTAFSGIQLRDAGIDDVFGISKLFRA